MINKKNRICFVAGKSGGHILPCLTLAQQYKQDNPESSILFFSTDASIDKSILKDQSTIAHHITLPLGHFSQTRIHRYIQITWGLAHSFVASLYYLHTHKIKKVVSTGGLVALPVCLASMFLRIPVELYELNAVPRRAIKNTGATGNPYTYTFFPHATKYCPK